MQVGKSHLHANPRLDNAVSSMAAGRTRVIICGELPHKP
jgi:hypothetical protein